MPVTALIELIAKPGKREELLAAHHQLLDVHKGHPGLLGMETYKTRESPDGIIEVAHWRSEEDHQEWRQGVIASGDAAPLLALLEKPISTRYLEKCS